MKLGDVGEYALSGLLSQVEHPHLRRYLVCNWEKYGSTESRRWNRVSMVDPREEEGSGDRVWKNLKINNNNNIFQ